MSATIQDRVAEAARENPFLSGCRVFDIPPQMWQAAWHMAWANFVPGSYVTGVPVSSAPPADYFLTDLGGELIYADASRARVAGGSVYLFMRSPVTGRYFQFARYVPGGPVFANPLGAVVGGVPMSREIGDRCVCNAAVFAWLMSLINTPRQVRIQAGALSRQQRRQAQRGMGFAVDAWHRVSWVIGKTVTDKVPQDAGIRGVPLHWRRGHFHLAEPHWKDAQWVPEYGGWRQWYPEGWVGNIAFGIKRSVHAPQLDIDVLSGAIKRMQGRKDMLIGGAA